MDVPIYTRIRVAKRSPCSNRPGIVYYCLLHNLNVGKIQRLWNRRILGVQSIQACFTKLSCQSNSSDLCPADMEDGKCAFVERTTGW
jgi:hypothetical protein